MPEIKKYRVTRTQEIEVNAADERKAFELADLYFENKAEADEVGWMSNACEIVEVNIKRVSLHSV